MQRHKRLIGALAEFKASGDQSDSVLGAFGLTIVFDFSLECGLLIAEATIHHLDGAWLRSRVPCPGLSIEQIPVAREMARSAVIGVAHVG